MRVNRTLTETIRMERFEEIYDEYRKNKLSCEEAAMILGCSSRQFLRQRERYDEDGLDGLKDRRVGRVSKRRAGDAEVERLTKLYKERYKGFNVRHFHEFSVREHGIKRGYTWTRGVLVRAGLVAPSGRGGPHRLRRERKPMRGMMIHQDGSKHPWFGDDCCDLIITMDDATSDIISGFSVRRRAPPAASGASLKPLKNMACSLRFTLIAAATISIRPKPEAKSTRPRPPKWAAP